uniref:Uncharacterized protein n=1 Tax=Rhizophora mucronata TaxID=61149 RepID=A0A2P2R468_RHIMU
MVLKMTKYGTILLMASHHNSENCVLD